MADRQREERACQHHARMTPPSPQHPQADGILGKVLRFSSRRCAPDMLLRETLGGGERGRGEGEGGGGGGVDASECGSSGQWCNAPRRRLAMALLPLNMKNVLCILYVLGPMGKCSGAGWTDQTNQYSVMTGTESQYPAGVGSNKMPDSLRKRCDFTDFIRESEYILCGRSRMLTQYTATAVYNVFYMICVKSCILLTPTLLAFFFFFQI